MTLFTGIKFKTSASVRALEDCLEANCNGEWEVEIESISTALKQKSVAVYFETDEDRDAFKVAYKTIK